ncbi:rhomboid family intramembrane serine protease [Rhizocola hellebori]|uniref:Rhomboid family intramembrane serine protease n=2 Tax=Rhizocola hellebori TaxID=1392758 RepID=A0A8J3QKI2_9ACTN|nr:rhomboid family intramembrane serine protease [Rhizocola hellebori]
MVVASVGHQCPECVAEGKRTQRQALTHFGGSAAGVHGYVTKALMALNVAVFLLVLVMTKGRALTGGITDLHIWGAVNGSGLVEANDGSLIPIGYGGVDGGEYYRLVTAMFLHYGIIHLALNMYALWVLGRSLEAALGPIRFGALYLLAGLGGNVACDLFAPDTLSAGASTAIYGLFSAYFLILRRLGRDASAVIPIIVINVVLTFTIPGISIAGHLGGLVTGAIVGAGLAYAPREHRTLVQTLVLVATFLGLMAITLALSLSR